MSIMKKLAFLCISLCMLPFAAHALTYYSKINSRALLEGTDDCWIINYSVWHDNNTVHNLTDDVLIGTRNTIVGTDCDPSLADPAPNDIPVEISHDSDLIIFPNPANDYLTIHDKSETSKPVTSAWTITSMTNVVMLAGRYDHTGPLTINIASLQPGQYLFTLLDNPATPLQRQFTILR
jgi:hypothetical protein